MATRVDNAQERAVVVKKVGDLETGELLYGIGDRVGFDENSLPGKIEHVARVDDQLTIDVLVLQLDERFRVKAAATDDAKVIKTIKPRQAKALKYAALAKLAQAEIALHSPQARKLQPKIARVRFMLEQELAEET